MADDDKPRASSRGRRRTRAASPPAEEPKPETVEEPTADPRLTGNYIAVTCLKYASHGNGKTIDAVPGDVLADLCDKDIERFRKGGAIKPELKG